MTVSEGEADGPPAIDETMLRARLAEDETAAIEKMIGWFFDQFEEESKDVAPSGTDDRPDSVADYLHSAFHGEYDPTWIETAADRIASAGRAVWTPRRGGRFDRRAPSGRAVEARLLHANLKVRLAQLEAIVATLPVMPTQLGHNAPPEAIGLPPYTSDTRHEIGDALAETQEAITSPTVDAARLTALSRRFEGWGTSIGGWVLRKADLAVDEAIKNAVRAAAWGGAVALFLEVADDLLRLARYWAGG